MMEWVFTVAIVILIALWIVNRAISARQRSLGHDRCAYCHARLRFLGVGKAGQQGGAAGFATVCSRCGREQPWAASSG